MIHLGIIIKNWFPGEYDALEEAHKHFLVDKLVENMSPEAFKEYLKRLETCAEG